MTDEHDTRDIYLPPGTPVRHDGLMLVGDDDSLVDGGPEYGVVIHCWYNNVDDVHDCYVGFFGNEQPIGKPARIPYVLRYPSMSLTVVDHRQPIKS